MANNPSNPPHQMSLALATTSDAWQHELANVVGQEANAAVKRGKATKCNDCNIIMNSEEQARSHFGGKNHQNRLKELGITVPENLPLNGLDASHTSKATVCTACKLTLNSEAQAVQHYKGKSHLNRIKELELGSEGGNGIGAGGGRAEGGGVSMQSNGAAVQAGTTSTVCTTCDVILNSVMQAKQHFEGKIHQMKCMGQGVIAIAAAPIPVKVDSFIAKRGGFGSVSVPNRTPQMNSFRQPRPINNVQGSNRFPAVKPLRGAQTYSGSQLVQPRPINNGQGSNQFPVEKPLRCDQMCLGGQLVQGAQPTEAPSLKRKAAEVSCGVCCLVLNSETQAALHFSSRRHIKRMKMQHEGQKQWNSVLTGETPELTPRKNRFYCQQCQLSVNSMSQLTAHMQGQQHRSKLQMGQHPYAISTLGQPGELSGMPTNVWTEAPGNKNGWFYCRTCDISVPTALNLSQHVQSDGHLEQKYQSYDVDGSHDSLDYAFPTWNEEPSQYSNDCYDYPNYVQY